MQLRAILFTIFGLCLAGGSVLIASTLIEPNSAGASQPEQPEFVRVLIAKSDIQFGEIISKDLLGAQAWPADSLPEGVFTGTRALLGPEDASPRRAIQVIRKGDLILEDRVSGFGEKVTIVQSLGTNTRAMAIEVDAVTAVGGFVMPGDRVDLVLTEGRGSDLRAATILQDIRVLGIDQSTGQEKKASRVARTITVEVTPREGQVLALAQRAGTLSLTLRTRNDVADTELEQISLADILESARKVEPAPEPVVTAPPARTIRVRRGTIEDVVELK
jgi:pilus assembly protein CpaB